MVRCMAVVVCLLTVLAGARTAEAQYFGRNKVHYDRLDFRVLQTEHFEIHYYAEEEEATRYAARMAERWYARFSRLLDHRFTRRQPVVLYASHPHFTQTNVTPGSPGEGTGGLTERTKSRIAMPFAAGLGETDHVLGHEIAHAFQIDVARRAGHDAFTMPGWFIEGMAEYMSLGGANANTMMWVRDASLHGRLPTLKQLDNPRYFPYRYGHALWAHLTETYGDELIGGVLRSKARNVVQRIEEISGLDQVALTNQWHEAIRGETPAGAGASPAAESPAAPTPRILAASASDGARLHLGPALSPDGTRIVFSALAGGLSDLWIYSLPTRTIRRLTADPYADLHPAWSPDGTTIAFATDRFTSELVHLTFGPLRLGLIDVSSGQISPLMHDASLAKQVSPQWAPGGGALYFVSDRDGISNVYRAEIASGELRQVTDVRGGVSGITSTSPALAVASKAGTLAFSVYRGGRYEIAMLDSAAAIASPVATEEITREEIAERPPATLGALLADSRLGLPDANTFQTTLYDDRLRLESIAPQYIGAAMGNGFGGLMLASFGFSFSDMLRDRQVQTIFRAGTDVDDLAGQVSYSNRRGRWNWGLAAGVVPSRFVGARRALERTGELVTRETASLRYMHQWGGVTARYHLNRAQRFEFAAGVRRTGFEWETVTRVVDSLTRKTVTRSFDESAGGKPIYLGEGDAAFVHDTAVSGPTSPVLGKRLRLEVNPALGGLAFADVRVDARRYFMPLRPVTLAARVSHVGRYGADASDARLTPLVYGLQSLVRGYDLRTFAADKCGPSATACSTLDQLSGSRFALLNLELRAPLLGLLRGDLYYGHRVPLEVIAFADAGFLWTRHDGGAVERDRFRSVGAGARANLGGMVFEMTAVRPFDRASSGWTASLLLRPGF